MTAVASPDDQLAVGEVRTVLAVIRNVRTLHIDLLRMERRVDRILCQAHVVAAIRCGRTVDHHAMRIGDLHVMAVRVQFDAVLGPGDVGRWVAEHVARQRKVGADGERVAVVQHDVCGDGNCTVKQN